MLLQKRRLTEYHSMSISRISSEANGREKVMRSYVLVFRGYNRESNIQSLPAYSGIYGVYACSYNRNSRKVRIRKLIYIGEAEKLNERISPNHENWDNWEKELETGEVFCFNYAKLSSPEATRKRVEAAMIYEHQPVCNKKGRKSFKHRDTKIKTSGKNKFMCDSFTAEQTVDSNS